MFVALEGTDGSGKTTVRKELFRIFRQCGTELLNITPHSWLLWPASKIIVEAKYGRQQHSAETVSRAYVRDKEELSRTLIAPNEPHRTVIADRFIATDMVYNFVMRGIPLRTMYQAYVESRVVWPHRHIFVRTDPAVALDRCVQRKSGAWNPWDDMERKVLLLQAYERAFYTGEFPRLGPVITIDNSGTPEQLQNEIRQRLVPLLLGKSEEPDGNCE